MTSAEPTDLTVGETYYWQVRALNSFGVTVANSGEWQSFITVAAAMDAIHQDGFESP